MFILRTLCEFSYSKNLKIIYKIILDMKSMTINMTKNLTKISKYFNSLYEQSQNYDEFDIEVPNDIDVDKFNQLINCDEIIYNEDDEEFDIIFRIAEYFQLNNVVLYLPYKDLEEYNKLYDVVTKKIKITKQRSDGIVDIPINTKSFSCDGCKNVLGFTGRADNMYFSRTSLAGVIDIPEGIEVFRCYRCKYVTGFTGYANRMYFDRTSLSGVIDIPEGIESFSCNKCSGVTGFTGYADIMNFGYTALSGIIEIPDGIKLFACNDCKYVTGFINHAGVMIFNKTSLSGTVNIPDGVEVFICSECKKVTGFTGRADEMYFNGTSLSGVIEIPTGTKSFSFIGCRDVTSDWLYTQFSSNIMNKHKL